MLNSLKTFFYAFKFIFSFLKKLFTKSSLEISGDNNQTFTNSNTQIAFDHSINKGINNSIENSFNQTTVSNTYNNYLSQQSSHSTYLSQNSSIGWIIAILIIFVFVLTYFNNIFIVQYIIPLKLLIFFLALACLISYIHIFILSEKRPLSIILFVLSFVLTIANCYFCLFRFTKASYLHVSLQFFKDNLEYLLPLIHFILMIPAMVLLLYSYSKSIIDFTNNNHKRFSHLPISIFFMCFSLGIIYAKFLYLAATTIIDSLVIHLMESLK